MMRFTSMQPRSWLLRALFALLIAYILIFTIGYTLEYRVEVGATRWLTASRIVLFVVACGYLWIARAESRRLVDPFALCLVAIIATGAVSGLLIEKEWFTYFRHAFQYAFLFAFYLVGRELALRAIPAICIQLISGTIFLGYAIATILYAATPGLQSGGYSFQPNLALLPVASSLSSGNWLGAMANTLIIVAGNKRAVYIGLAIMVATYLALRVSKRWRLRPLGRIVLVGVTAPVIGIAFGFVTSVLTSSMSSYLTVPVPTVVDRFTLQPTFNAGAEATPAQEAKVDLIVRLTSARSVEVQTVWEMVKRSPAEALFGHGFGTEFTVKYISPNDYEPVQFDRSQADLEPVQIALTSGLPLALLFTAMHCGIVAMAFVRLTRVEGVNFTIALFSIGSLLDTLLGFHATNPLCWMALGIVSRQMLPEFSATIAQSPPQAATT
ncbi:O-antigen ligase family protein [Bradyrhizobium sp. 174]|uniref:O-antigen ligase family protein n=1 Tax=Bradyrhizobium sp. 174 TaxID=2782645 RepID=UPI001FFB4CEE|nr:O-antigen ligase family protein [Bradyrhizobium sp. 174]MCK1575917.1 O-antigen ligase family protein [Bradyrhizobium sp. 174]